MMKNVFYFNLKAFSFSRYLSLWHDFLVMSEKWLDQKDQVNFQNSWRHKLVYKQLQYTYCQTSHKVKATTKWNFLLSYLRSLACNFNFENKYTWKLSCLTHAYFLFIFKSRKLRLSAVIRFLILQKVTTRRRIRLN